MGAGAHCGLRALIFGGRVTKVYSRRVLRVSQRRKSLLEECSDGGQEERDEGELQDTGAARGGDLHGGVCV
jgi:hypothetical protein